MNKKVKIAVYSFVGLLIIFLIALPKLSTSKGDNSANAAANKKILSVNVHVVKAQKLDNKVLTSGTVMANEEVELKSEVSGKITKILFKEGSYVKEGDLLVKINDAELQAQQKKAKYDLKLLEDKEYRQKTLLNKEAISQAEYDATLNELNTHKADVELIQAQITKTEISAPFSGIVGLKNVSEGSYITPSVVIATLQNVNPVKVDFSIPEKYAGSVNTGDQVNFKVEGVSENYIGKVYAIEPKINPVTRTLQLRAVCPNKNGKIHPGAFADVELVLKQIDNAIMVPSQAIIPELKGQKVYLLKNNVVVPKSVETGVRTDTKVQVTNGLTENDTLITSGILQVRPGTPVTISGYN